MSLTCLIGYPNNNRQYQDVFEFANYVYNPNEIVLLSFSEKKYNVNIRKYDDYIIIECKEYLYGYGVRIRINNDNTGRYTIGLNSYDSGASGDIEPVLIPAFLEMIKDKI